MTTADYPPEFYSDINHYLDDEWLCVYCLAPTMPADERCPRCNKPLVVARRTREERSVWLWRGIFTQIGLILIVAGMWASSMTLVLKFNGIPDPVPFLPAYLGLPVEQPPELVERALQLYPRWIFWGFAAVTLLSFALIFLLYFRVKHGNTIYLISGGLTLLLGTLAIALFFESWIVIFLGFLAAAVGLLQLFITMNLWDDFTFKYRRLGLRIDSGAKNHPTLYITGRAYANAGMWGLAVIHFRRAVGRNERKAVYHLALAVAYYNLRRYDLAAQSLDAAERLDPGAPEIEELRQKIASVQP